jgi:hypothetical protein
VADRLWFVTKISLLIVGIAGPFVLVWLSRRVTRGKRESIRVGALFGACVLGTGLLPVALWRRLRLGGYEARTAAVGASPNFFDVFDM